jgi:hypothetical protein
MSSKNHIQISKQSPAESMPEPAFPLVVPAWQPDGPTLRFKELLKVIRVGKSKAYELIKSDPKFPKGTPLYDGPRSPKFYWTHEALAWASARTTKFRSQGCR